MSSFGETLKSSMNQSVDSMLERCKQIITSKCSDQASRGFGCCRFDWSVEFTGINILFKDIKQIVDDLGGLTIVWNNDFGFCVKWVDHCEIEDYKKSRKDCKKDRKEKAPISNAQLPTIVEEHKDEISTSMTE